MSLRIVGIVNGPEMDARRLFAFLIAQTLLLSVLVWGDPLSGIADPDNSVGLTEAEPVRRRKPVVPSYTRHSKTMREICLALAIDGRLEDFQRVVRAQPKFSLECPTCRPFYRAWLGSCQGKAFGKPTVQPSREPIDLPTGISTTGKESVQPESDASGGTDSAVTADQTADVPPTTAASPAKMDVEEEEESVTEDDELAEGESGDELKPSPTPRPTGPERDPNIVALDLVSGLFQSLAEGEGADLSLRAIDLLVRELRDFSGKSESAYAYFGTLTEFMLAPFESVREQQANNSPDPEDLVPNPAVNEMFDL
jgi:hypothetical protein